MPRQILIDQAARGYLAARMSICQRPALIDRQTWDALRRAEMAGVDIAILAACADVAGEPNLVDGMVKASRLWAQVLLPYPVEA